MNKIKIIENKGQRVLTTEQLAEIYGTDINNIKNNFNNHKNNFIEEKHYYFLQGKELKEFKNQVNNIDLVGKRAASLYLWTERGASRHCKILDTNQAWEQFDNLEETYFNVKEQKQITAKVILNNPDFIINILQQYKKEKEEVKRLTTENKIKDEVIIKLDEKAVIVDEFLNSDNIYSISNVAKILAIKGMGRNNFYKYLRENNIIMTDENPAKIHHYEAFSIYTNSNSYFKHQKRIIKINGNKDVNQMVAFFTPKGIQWIIKRLKKDGYICTKTIKQIINEL